MAEIVVVGAGVAGLGCALTLAKAGHEVTVLERDRTPYPADPEAAFDWDRRGAPQVRHSHALLARLRNILVNSHPEVLERLLAAGATEIDFLANRSPEMQDVGPQPGDDELVAIACRRTTFEWVLRGVVMEQPGVRLLDGVAVSGLRHQLAPDAAAPPVVTGVDATCDGTAVSFEADLVVVANGRRSILPTWLSDIGVAVGESTEDTGIVYLSRFYRLAPDADPPQGSGPVAGDLGYLKYGLFQGDNRTFSVTLASRVHDRELRARISEPDGFDAAARSIDTMKPWLATETATAITDVAMMAKLINRRRLFVTEGTPAVLGVHAVGDCHTATNPLYGRGCSMAMVSAEILGQSLAEHGADHHGRALEYEAAHEREILPWYLASVASDADTRRAAAEARAAKEASANGEFVDGDASPVDTGADSRGDFGDDTVDPEQFIKDVMREGLMPAVRTDPYVMRAFLRTVNLLSPPHAMMSDPDVIGRVLASYQERHNRPAEAVVGPKRSELLETLG